MVKVKVFTDKQTDKLTNGQTDGRTSGQNDRRKHVCPRSIDAEA